LGTDDEATAKHLEARMNALLARQDLHSVGSRADAIRDGFEPTIVEIFYGDLDPSATSHRAARDRLLPLPAMGPGHAVRTLILGNSGVGKTTLLRRLIGSDPARDRFPATSTNRTTTCEIEIVSGRADYSAAVTFLSRHQVQQEVTESLSNAVLKAIESAADEIVMKTCWTILTSVSASSTYSADGHRQPLRPRELVVRRLSKEGLNGWGLREPPVPEWRCSHRFGRSLTTRGTRLRRFSGNWRTSRTRTGITHSMKCSARARVQSSFRTR